MPRPFVITDEPEVSSGPRIPTVKATGKAIHQHAPTSVRTSVTIAATATSREQAWEKFHALLGSLRDQVGVHGELGNSVPTQTEEEVNKPPRTLYVYTVTDSVEVTFSPSNFGQVIRSLVSCDLQFTSPTFVFDKSPDVAPDLLTRASAAARLNAKALAEGIGHQLGRLVAIATHSPVVNSRIGFPHFLNQVANRSSMSGADDFDSWQIDDEKIETYDTEVYVTVEFEVIPETSDQEVTQ